MLIWKLTHVSEAITKRILKHADCILKTTEKVKTSLLEFNHFERDLSENHFTRRVDGCSLYYKERYSV